MILTLLLILAWPPPPPLPRAPNAFRAGKPYRMYDPRNLVDVDPPHTAAVLAFSAAADATYRSDFTDAELERWCAVKKAGFEMERTRRTP